MENILTNRNKIHFVGIGGSGMCPMAEILHADGFTITGSDNSDSETVQRIKNRGITVFIGNKAENVGDVDMLVYSAAVKQDNPELVRARELGIVMYERSVVLGAMTDRYKKSIAVSGTHGKTTTTAMISQILIEANFDPSAIIGGRLPLIGSNSLAGKSDYIVCEACEYVDTFLHLHPHISVILNVEADHLDYFENLDNILKSFNKFSSQTSGIIVVNGDDENSLASIKGIDESKILTFGTQENCDCVAKNIKVLENACECFDLYYKDDFVCVVELSVPGVHNRMNALAAACVALYLGVPSNSLAKSLNAFTGVHRRFEVLGSFNGITVADDFAHHPTELRAILTATSKMNYKNVWAVFQPHTFSRTFLLLDDFADALSIPEHVVMTEILAVRETNTYGVDIMDLETKIPGSCHFASFEEIADYVMKNAQSGDLILTLGGGDIYKCANLIVEKYKDL